MSARKLAFAALALLALVLLSDAASTYRGSIVETEFYSYRYPYCIDIDDGGYLVRYFSDYVNCCYCQDSSDNCYACSSTYDCDRDRTTCGSSGLAVGILIAVIVIPVAIVIIVAIIIICCCCCAAAAAAGGGGGQSGSTVVVQSAPVTYVEETYPPGYVQPAPGYVQNNNTAHMQAAPNQFGQPTYVQQQQQQQPAPGYY